MCVRSMTKFLASAFLVSSMGQSCCAQETQNRWAAAQTSPSAATARARNRQSVTSQKGIPTIAKAADGAIVSIILSDKEGRSVAQGSGFLISNDGLVVTNYHVIDEGSSAVVKLPDGAFYVVDGVLAFDKIRDVAVIKAHGKNFRALTLGNSDRVQVGEEVVAIGNPLSLESTVSSGIISGIRTDKEMGGKFLQITTPISLGSSGGPLFNMAGDVVGITTLYLKGGNNLNFAIPINDVKGLLSASADKLQHLPNETKPTDTSAANSPAQTHLDDRGYYQQLYKANGFAHPMRVYNPDGSPVTSSSPLPMIRDTDYVCFSDNANSGTFFTFRAYAYDEKYAQAADKEMHSTSSEDILKEAAIQQGIQDELPYVDFMPNEVLAAYPPDGQKFFRLGGKILEETIYEKGVKTNNLLYHWDGSSWVRPIPPADPNAYSRTSKVLRLSIEPTTMRYVDSISVTITVGNGETAATDTRTLGPWPGICERVPNPK